MHLTPLTLQALTVNPNNDRHGELEDEACAIGWLLTHREQHMRNLAADIVTQGKIYEPPLVAQDRNKYVVYDGNRRVTCLKLLAAPSAAPTQQLKEFFDAQRAKWRGRFPTSIDCQIETDREAIDEILFRRHTGSQSGVGQSHWDDAAKHNFISRTGQKSGRNVAEGIEKKLLASGYIATEGILPRSNLNRLLSSEDLRNAVGISFVDGKLYFTSPPEKALSALSRIAADLISKRLVLGHIWNNEGKRQYLAELKSHGALPAAEDVLTIPVAFEEATVPKRPTSPPVRYDLPSGPRATLIPNDIDYSVIWSARTTRLRDIWKELQQLSIERYPNAVAVSFRVFLELAVDNYIAVSAIVGVNESDGLRKKVDRVAAHLADRGTIAEKYKKELQKFASDEAIISTSAMHRYVHSLTYAPSPRHLTAIWDTLSEFLVRCVNENRDRQAA